MISHQAAQVGVDDDIDKLCLTESLRQLSFKRHYDRKSLLISRPFIRRTLHHDCALGLRIEDGSPPFGTLTITLLANDDLLSSWFGRRSGCIHSNIAGWESLEDSVLWCGRSQNCFSRFVTSRYVAGCCPGRRDRCRSFKAFGEAARAPSSRCASNKRGHWCGSLLVENGCCDLEPVCQSCSWNTELTLHR